MTPHPAIVAFDALHRRLVRARMLRDGSVGLAAGICVLPLAADAGGAVAVAAVGAAAGLVHGALRAPRALDAARLLDRRLGLADRLVTCLAVARQDDAVSRLVLDDTVERLQPISRAGVAPMGAAAAVARVAAAAMVAVLAGAPDMLTTASGSRVTEHTTAAGAGDEPTAEMDGAAPGEGAGGASNPIARPERRAVEGGGARAARSPTASIPAPGGPGYLESTPGAGGGAQAGGGESGETATAQARAASTEANAGGQVRAGGEGLSTAIPGAGAAEAEPFSPPSGRGIPVTARVEAALQRANVPPGLRRYVVNYFRAIGQ